MGFVTLEMSLDNGEILRSGAIFGTVINLVGLYPFDSDGVIKNGLAVGGRCLAGCIRICQNEWYL